MFLSLSLAFWIPYLHYFPHISLWSTYLLFDSHINFTPLSPHCLHESLFMKSVISVCPSVCLAGVFPPLPSLQHRLLITFVLLLWPVRGKGPHGQAQTQRGGLPALRGDSWLRPRTAAGGTFNMPSQQEMLGTVWIKISVNKKFLFDCLCSQEK